MPKVLDESFPADKGKLFSFSKGELKVLKDEVGLSNGLAWSRDNKTLFYADSLPAKKVLAFDYDDSGNICKFGRHTIPTFILQYHLQLHFFSFGLKNYMV